MLLSTTPTSLSPSPSTGAFATSLCDPLPWDSRIFGFNIGRLRGSRLTPERGAEALKWCRDHQIECLYFLADASDPLTAQAAQTAGFRFVDVRCTYECHLPLRWPGILATAVRPLEPADVPTLERIAAANHRDSRFYFDHGFNQERCNELFVTWIRRSCSGRADAVFVAGFAGCPAGYITCDILDRDTGSIGLMAVDPQFQGHGFGEQLVAAAHEHLRKRGVRRVQVVTHGRNLRSQQMYQRCGFAIRGLELWYHLWPARS